jgi:hypothetical protein
VGNFLVGPTFVRYFGIYSDVGGGSIIINNNIDIDIDIDRLLLQARDDRFY